MENSPNWDLYRSFLSVVKTGSLSAAARELGLTQPTLGRHIAELESALDLALFARSPNGLAPTEAALSLKEHAEALASAANAFVRAASGEAAEPRGSVRIAASVFVGAEVLPSILTAFRESNPQIVIELSLSDRNEDLLRRDADVAIRMARPTQSALRAKRIGSVEVGLYAHRRYLKVHGLPRTPEAIAGHALIGFDADSSSIRAMRQSGLPITREMFALRTDSEHARLSALRAGFGIGGCQVGVAVREPDLIRVLPKEFSFDLEMWLVMHEDLKSSRRVRLLFDYLVPALADYARRPPSGAGRTGPRRAPKNGLPLRRPDLKP
jgi:DNA-binding transcriptional LysR family regulator